MKNSLPEKTTQDLHQVEYFKCEKAGSEIIFHFPDLPTPEPGQIPLRAIVRTFTLMKQMSQTPIKYLYLVLGKLRFLNALIGEYNAGIGKEDAYYSRYIAYQVLQVFSVFGFQIPSKSTRIHIPGLSELIASVEDVYKQDIEYYTQIIKEGSIVFDGLQELYKPNVKVCGMTALGVPACFKVVQSHFVEHKTLFGIEKSFHLEMQYVATLGNDFGVVEFEVTLSKWMGEANKKLVELPYFPADPQQLEKFAASGQKYVALGLGSPKFLQHSPGSVFLHPQRGKTTTTNSSIALSGSGRILIDVAKGSQLGHFASHGMDDPTFALMGLSQRYKRHLNAQNSLGDKKTTNPESIFLLSSVPAELLDITWPALVGFSFAAKCWCHALVGGLSDIKYNDTAFDELVLDPSRKRLIKALVKFGGEQFEDIIQGKHGGSIFLLHGPPGVGKTLTAEAIAEVLHRPLYYVTMGELGTDPETMENRISEVLDLCSGWEALVLIDEADVFLEKRATSDVLRNAMVCVMLRLLEYHQGILFLTTNRVTEFDPAFESRVTVALKYEHLTESARVKVWQNLISRLPCKIGQIDYEKLGKVVLNGRQIKNSVRLGVALAMDSREALNQDILDETIAVTNLGRLEMSQAQKF